ncbi:MAG TPA: CinA family protein [Usitatibacter sp.]|jgi:nicotinamide-nucleotide amidase|nr:CinA family protein [Usitatibacter sp.]
MSGPTLMVLVRRLGRECLRQGASVSVAESCTGGGLAAAITSVPGSSAYFDRGFVTYSNEAKQELLGVSPRALARFGAVSEETARAMALGVLKQSPARLAVSVTGIAGPGGATPGKPVGLVWIAWARRRGLVVAREFHFRGGRAAVRRQAVAEAIAGLLEVLEK